MQLPKASIELRFLLVDSNLPALGTVQFVPYDRKVFPLTVSVTSSQALLFDPVPLGTLRIHATHRNPLSALSAGDPRDLRIGILRN